MKYNYKKLKNRIREYYDTQEEMAKILKISATALNNKLNNKTKFNIDEVYSLKFYLNILPEEIDDIFFNTNVGRK